MAEMHANSTSLRATSLVTVQLAHRSDKSSDEHKRKSFTAFIEKQFAVWMRFSFKSGSNCQRDSIYLFDILWFRFNQ